MINVKNIYWMLAYAFRILNKTDISKVGTEEFDNIYDMFAVMITRGINYQIKKGINREYIEYSDEISTVKGKIDLSETIKRKSLLNKRIVCTFDDYSTNSYLNRIIKTASCYLLKSNKLSKDNRNNLRKTLYFFDDVELLDKKTIQWNSIRYNKNNSSYKLLINISYLILEGLIVNKENDRVEFLDYIDDQKMHKLYEKFLYEYYKYHFPELNPSVPQVKWDTDEKMISLFPIMQTDLMLEYKDKKLIIDAKYYSKIMQSQFDKETFRNNNIYQIYTYVKNKDIDNTGNVMGLLLYAKTDEENIGWNEQIIGNNTFIITDLDLSNSFEIIKEKLNKISDYLYSITVIKENRR